MTTALLFKCHIKRRYKRRYRSFRKGIEKATKILPALKKLSDSERSKICQIPTLHYRRIRGDMIETYKTVTGKYQTCIARSLKAEDTYVTRVNDLRLQKSHVEYNLRKFGFSNRVVNIWNSLPNWVVSAINTDTFKAGLDKFGANKILCMILEHSCREPEVEAKCCISNCIILVYFM